MLFNVYGGAAMTLEALHLLRDGGVRRVFFVGSMYAKHIPICTLVIPRRVFDRAGIVSLETTGSMSLPTQSINALESSLKSLNLEKLERLVALKEQQPRQLSWKT